MRGRFGLSIFFPGGKSIFDGGKIQSSRNSSWNIRSSTEMSPSIRIAASSPENYSKSAQQTLSSDSAEMSPMMSAHPHVSGHQRMSMYSTRWPRENFHSLLFSDLPDHVNSLLRSATSNCGREFNLKWFLLMVQRGNVLKCL